MQTDLKSRNNVKETTLNVISELLTDICEESNSRKDTNSELIKPFLSKKKPAITIRKFLERIVNYTKIENSTLVLTLIYIDRLCDIQKFKLNYLNIHKIIIGALILAIKYNEDEYFDSTFYSKVTGVSKKTFEKIEYEMLSLIKFSLYVKENVFEKYNNYLQSEDYDDDNETQEEEVSECALKEAPLNLRESIILS